ncbi:MAG: 1-acyl-sn-glycerol-3-phosphate acyltransferase [Flavobacteriales bacterium]|nr:1-acyl-sn-glycerol-3-phosphate acyltransferase [Flavobacteriales bacterium]
MRAQRWERAGSGDAGRAPIFTAVRPLYKLVFLKLLGWELRDERPAQLDRFIIVVAPHTSNWDFVVGLAVRSIARLTDVKFLAKDSLFGPLTGWFFRALGGFPVNRSTHNNMVDAVVDLFKRGAIKKIAITPEGTRKYQPNWKTGFHRIATGAGVPIILCTFDFKEKLVIITAPFPLTADPEADIERMKDWFRPHKGKNPDNGVR